MLVVVLFTLLFLIFLHVIWIKYVLERWKVSASDFLLRLLKNEDKQFVHSGDTVRGSVRSTCDNVRALVVVAHPDDECMFFAPAILRLLELNVSVHLLCLSSGNYYSQGNLRKSELKDSCQVLGISPSHVTIIDNKELPDDPKAHWAERLVSSLITKEIKENSVNLVLTFDDRGVSGHGNHIAIYRALRYLVTCGRVPDGCHFLTLQSVSLPRKYLSFLELPISCLCSLDFSCVIGLKCYKQAKRAMSCHRSQLFWFRHLYLLTSRYMFINTFRVISQEKKDLKIY